MRFNVDFYTPKGTLKSQIVEADKLMILQGNLAFYRDAAARDERAFLLISKDRWSSVTEDAGEQARGGLNAQAAERPLPAARG